MLLSVLGLILSALTLLELRPQLSIRLDQELESGQPLSVPIRLENVGYLAFYVDRAFLYVHHAKAGGMNVTDGMESPPDWGGFDLDQAQGKSIVSHYLRMSVPLDEADIIVVIDVKPGKHFPFSMRHYFRFTRFDGPQIGPWVWMMQPISAELVARIDRRIKENMAEMSRNLAASTLSIASGSHSGR